MITFWLTILFALFVYTTSAGVEVHQISIQSRPGALINNNTIRKETSFSKPKNISNNDKDQRIIELKNQLSSTINDTMRVNIYIKLSQLTDNLEIKQLENYSNIIVQLSEKINFEKGIAYGKYYLGSVFVNFDFDYTEKLTLESLRLAIKLKDSLLIARIYNLIGNLKSNTGNPEASFINYKKALSILLKNKMDSMAAGVYNNIGNYYSAGLDSAMSLHFYRKAIEVNEKTENYQWLAVNYTNIGNVYLRLNNSDRALEYFTIALNIANNKCISRLLPSIYYNISQCYVSKRKFSKAKSYARIALIKSEEQLDRLNSKCVLDLLNEIYYNTGNIDSAYLIQKEILALNDSIYKYSKLKELTLLDIKYKYEEEQKQKEIEYIQLKNNSYKNGIRYTIIISIVVITLLFILLLYIIQRGRINKVLLEQKNTIEEKEKLSKELDSKKKELTTSLLYMVKKNEFISVISDKLKDINSSSTESNKAIKEIISELNKNTNSDLWKDFEVRFQEVHIDFYSKLSRLYPDLTPNELKLCAFLSLNMTSKEIASITYQSLQSIKVARYRLRKKLGLSRDNNLVSYLINL